MRFAVPIGALALLLLAASCAVGPDYATPEARVAEAWMENPAAAPGPYGAAEATWWRQFDDEVLNRLEETAWRGNLSLQMAGVRILEARARLNRSVGDLFPQQQGITGQVNYSRLNDDLLSQIPGYTPDFLSSELLFAASWEIDIWGKYRRMIESDRAAFLGSVLSYDDAMVTLLADVAGSYLNIRTLEERLRVARENLQEQAESLRIASARFRAGETSERDVQQATTRLAQTRAQVPLLEEALRQTKNGLAVLLGQTPGEVDKHLAGPSRIPAVPARVAVGIPRDLIRRRPDVRAAGLSAAAQCALIGVAKANMYPALTLAGEFGVSSTNEGNQSLGDMFSWESRALKGGSSFLFPVFNYGRLINWVRVQDARFQEAILRYQNTVLVAQQEVENGLAAFARQQEARDQMAVAAAAARRTTELAMIQYKDGQTDYTTVLTAEQEQWTVEDALASARGNVALALVSVYRALGGGWEVRGDGDVISDPVKAEMAARTNWGKMLEPSRHLPSPPPEDGTAQERAQP